MVILLFTVIFWFNNPTYTYNIMHLKLLQNALSLKNTIVASGCDFRGLGTLLVKPNFSGAQLSNSLFNVNDHNELPIVGTRKIPGQNSDLSGANFSGANLVSVNFSGAVLKGAIFDNADIRYSDFTKADLTGAKLNKAKNISLARFCGATMPDGSIFLADTWQSSTGKIFYSHCAS